jgi:tetratricopeptide (TPR) repeat protein
MKNIIALALTGASLMFIFGCAENKEEQKKKELDIEYLRIIGRAYLEEDRLEEAEDTYHSLLDMAPDDASSYANLALVFLKQNKYKEAETEIKRALKKAPENPDIRMISAKYFELTRQPEKAITELEEIIEKKPDYVKALYTLAGMYEQSEVPDALANREKYLKQTMEKAPASIAPRLDLIALLMKKGDYDGAASQLEELPKIFPEFPNEAAVFYDKTMAALHASDPATAAPFVVMFQNFMKVTARYQSGLRDLEGPDGSLAGLSVVSISDFNMMHSQTDESILDRIRFLDISANMGLNPSLEDGALPAAGDGNSSAFALGDYDGDGYVDVYFSSYSSQKNAASGRLLRNHRGVWFEEQNNEAGINHSGRETDALFGDYDNDGYLDLYVVKDGPNALYKNNGNGAFADVAATAKVDDAEAGNKSLFLDAGHDGDLDLLVNRPGPNFLYRNNSDGTFSEMAVEMGLGAPVANCSDAAFADFDEDGDLDIFMANEDGPGTLFTNERHSKFSDITTASGLQNSKAATAVAAADYNNDGFTDLLLLSKASGKAELFNNRGDGTFEPASAKWLKAIRQMAALDASFFDFDNDGFPDLLVVGKPTAKGGKGVLLFHNNGAGDFEDVSNLLPSSLASGHQIGTADYDKDGDLDVFVADLKGELHLLQNEGGNINHYLKLQLVGLRNGNSKNNHFGIGAKVEMRAGELYQMKTVTEPNIHFGLGSHLKADVVRILWTNGVPQNLFFPGSDQDLIESQVLKGSCAFLYTWDGEKYVFSKDMMWRSALGMPLGIMGVNTAYAPADPSQEYLKIPGEQMKLQGGKYIVQITEELWESAYFDKLELVAIDHPQVEQVFVDERFTLPPYTDEYDLFAVRKKWHPVSAVDAAGTGLLPQILKKDDQYISNFQVDEYQGITEARDLVLDPGTVLPSGDLMLYLNGWIFPSDASINVALGQSSKLEVIPPQLQVVNKNGDWETVIPNMGFPMGKDKTMIVDLSGKFLSNDRRVRIRTNMEIYWDEIFFAPKARPGKLKATRLSPASAGLHYRGFSQLYRKGGRYGPHWFDYDQVSMGQKWRDLIGNYTRFGEVAPLLTAADDKLVIMNSGDEMTVTFDAGILPPLPAGWERDFLIYSEGWIKDGDLNTAHSKTVEPLPFHGMTKYPYDGDESFPSDAELQEYLKKYNTRKVGTEQFRREVMDSGQ